MAVDPETQAPKGPLVQKKAPLQGGERLVRWLTFEEVDRPPGAGGVHRARLTSAMT